MENKDVKIESANQINFRGVRFPIIAVYHNTRDYPGVYVGRVFDSCDPTNTVIIRDSLEELQEDIRQHTDMVWLKRMKEEEDVLIGTWI